MTLSKAANTSGQASLANQPLSLAMRGALVVSDKAERESEVPDINE
jgi:hypothetical protein